MMIRYDDAAHLPSPDLGRAWALGQQPAGRVTASNFAAALADECRSIDARVRATIRRSTARKGIPYPPHVVLFEKLTVGAWCRPGGEAGELQIQMGLGTLLAIDDLAPFAATMASFLIPARAAMNFAPGEPRYRLNPPLRVVGEYQARPGRFYDYRQAVTAAGVAPPGILFALPTEDWRLAQAALVAEMAIAWILFHEYSHWALAHPFLLAEDCYRLGFADHGDVTPRRFSFGEGRRPARRRDLRVGRVLEIHADTAAFHLLVNYARAARGPVERFNRAMAREPRRADPQCLAQIDHPQTVRLCMTAAALACIVLDGSETTRRGSDATHPSPSARYMNLQSQAPLTVPGLLGEVDGHLVVIEDQLEGFSVPKLAEMIALATTDVQLIAAISSLARDRRDRPKALDPRTWHRKAWRADMRRQWRTGVENPDNRTAAGRELDRLPLDDDALNTALRQVQADTFGGLFDIYMDGPA